MTYSIRRLQCVSGLKMMIDYIPSFSSRRILPKFDVAGGMNSATFAELYKAGLYDFFERGLAHKVWENDHHSFTLYPKTIPSLPYEALATLLPKHDINKQIKTIDELSPDILLELLNSAMSTLSALRETALEDGYTPRHGFIFQHVGPNDAYPKASFNTSYLPLHFHIQLYGYSLDNFRLFSKANPINITSPEYKHFFHDAATLVARDLLESSGVDVKRRGKTALELDEQPLDKQFDQLDALQLIAFQQAWKHHWFTIASCFTDFSGDSYDRYALYEKNERLARLKTLIEGEYGCLSEEARLALTILAQELKDEEENSCFWTYKGVNGSAGYVIDYEKGSKVLVFSPKLFTNSYRHFDVVGQDFIITKDKFSDELASQNHTEQILDIQRRLISKLQSPQSFL